MRKSVVVLMVFLLVSVWSMAENGYELWLRYRPLEDKAIENAYRNQIADNVVVAGESQTAVAIRRELQAALKGLFGFSGEIQNLYSKQGGLVIGTPNTCALIKGLDLEKKLQDVGDEGYLLFNTRINKKNTLIVAANTDLGALYGAFHVLRLMKTMQPISSLNIAEKPKTKFRLLNHWDNLNRTVERGYAGFSLWDWHKLPDYIDQRYIDYARANASIGINGTVLTNVNANALILTPQYLEKVAALAKVFRPYGIKVYLTARFSAPVEIGKLKSSDPLLPEVQDWWEAKADEIYALIPDFGGFLVKANSEGQPGPQNYGRNHHDGANMLAKAVGDRGIVMWRAFVYDNNVPDDRARQAYNEFKPLDGSFRNNVFVQVKNGPIDFQPREPFHPLFGAMPKTPLMMEFQITQEYLGCATHLVYLAPMYKEVLDADTYAHGKGTTVANIIDGSADGHNISGMAGVSNIGNDINWTGHPFAQSNWYAFGRLAWDHGLSSEDIANEWLRMTFTNNPVFLKTAKSIMLQSHETTVSYMTPIGLHHIMAWDHHWGPGPWVNIGRPDWTSLYYHRADTIGIGFNRTTTGSNSVGQYHQPVANTFNDIEKIPEKYLLWFHHVPWNYKMKSGRTLWEEMVFHYYAGAEAVQAMQQQWDSIEGVIDDQRFVQVKQLLAIQYKEAVWWRNACVLYFQQFSRMPIPAGYEQPEHTLEHYQNLKFHFVPGI